MLRMVLADYRMEFKENWKNVFNLVSLMIMLFYSFFIPAIETSGADEILVLPVIMYGIILLLFQLSMQLGMLYPNRLGKMYYVMPVSDKEKKQYLIAGYWIRVFVGMFVCTGHLSAMLFLKLLNWQMAVFIWLVLFFTFMLNNTHTKAAHMGATVGDVMTVTQWIGVISGIIVSVIFIPEGVYGVDYKLYEKITMVLGLMVLVGSTIVAMYQCYKTKMKEIDAGLSAK